MARNKANGTNIAIKSMEDAKKYYGFDKNCDFLFIRGRIREINEINSSMLHLSVVSDYGDDSLWSKITACNSKDGSGRNWADELRNVPIGTWITALVAARVKETPDYTFLNLFINRGGVATPYTWDGMKHENVSIDSLEKAKEQFGFAGDYCFVDGTVTGVERISEHLTRVKVAVTGEDGTTLWTELTATNPLEGNSGPKMADFFAEKGEKGQRLVAVCKAVEKPADEKNFLNLYIRKCSLIPKAK